MLSFQGEMAGPSSCSESTREKVRRWCTGLLTQALVCDLWCDLVYKWTEIFSSKMFLQIRMEKHFKKVVLRSRKLKNAETGDWGFHRQKYRGESMSNEKIRCKEQQTNKREREKEWWKYSGGTERNWVMWLWSTAVNSHAMLLFRALYLLWCTQDVCFLWAHVCG